MLSKKLKRLEKLEEKEKFNKSKFKFLKKKFNKNVKALETFVSEKEDKVWIEVIRSEDLNKIQGIALSMKVSTNMI